MILTVNVTEDHIKCGRKKDPCGCPITLAVRDLFVNPKTTEPPIVVSVDGECINFRRPGALPNALVQDWEFDPWVMPISLKKFILTFDAGEKVKPFSFEFDADDTLLPYLAKGVTYK